MDLSPPTTSSITNSTTTTTFRLSRRPRFIPQENY
jgi:hypothetical protein